MIGRIGVKRNDLALDYNFGRSNTFTMKAVHILSFQFNRFERHFDD